MIVEIIVGGIIGMGLMGGLLFLSLKRSKPSPGFQPEDHLISYDLGYREEERTLEQKLRNAVTDCERNEQICIDELDKLYWRQAELLDGIGKPSYIFVANKPYAFVIQKPITGEKRYYYDRDLLPNIEPAVREKTLALTQQYQQNIDFLISKMELCQQLKKSHQENLTRLGGLQQQSDQVRKLIEHENHLQDSSALMHKIEESGIEHELKLKEIKEEVDFQQECMQQYIQLNQKYSVLSDEGRVPEELKAEIDRLKAHLEDQDVD